MKLLNNLLLLLAVTTTAAADPVGGPISHPDVVQAYDTDVYQFAAYGDETTIIRVAAQLPTFDLDCWVYDDLGRQVASDTNATGTCIMRLHPHRAGAFNLRIRNLEPFALAYTWQAY